MKLRLALAASLVVPSFMACSASERSSTESVGTSEDELMRAGAFSGNTATLPTDAGVKDTGVTDTRVTAQYPLASSVTIKDLAPSGPTSCAPHRWDVVVRGRTCWDLAKRTPKGLYAVTPLFPDAPPAIRDTRCAVTFIPDAPGCAPGEPYLDFALSCSEGHTLTMRSDACAANPAACNVTASVDTATAPSPHLPEHDCTVVQIDGGIGGNGVGSCDSCGEAFNGSLLITNPYGIPTVNVGLVTAGTPTPIVIHAAPYSSFVIPLPANYPNGPVSIWR